MLSSIGGHHEGHYRQRKDGRRECKFTLPAATQERLRQEPPEVRVEMEETLAKPRRESISRASTRPPLTSRRLDDRDAAGDASLLHLQELRFIHRQSHLAWPRRHDARRLHRAGRAALPQRPQPQRPGVTLQVGNGAIGGNCEARADRTLTPQRAVHPRHPTRRTRASSPLGVRRAQRGRPRLTTPAEAQRDAGSPLRRSATADGRHKDDRLGNLFAAAINTGMRQGELEGVWKGGRLGVRPSR